MKKFTWILIFICMLIFVTACKQSERAIDDTRGMSMIPSAEYEVEMMEATSNDNHMANTRPIQTIRSQNERKIVYTAYISMNVSNFETAEQEIEKLVLAEEGYIVHSSVNNDRTTEIKGMITARIPVASFQTFIKHVGDISNEVMEQSVNGEDVTEEYVDVEARLKAKLATKEQLDTFLEEAETMEDLLAVTEQLSHLQTEIEQLEGRIKYLTNQSDYATVTISIVEKSVNIGTIRSKDLNIWTRSQQLFVSTIHTMISISSSFIVFLIGMSPVIIPISIIGAVIYFYVRRKKKQSEGR